ncbi:MAG TPA: hypothetical protein VK447_14240 [Myxococcaceae bacterium]|nr:hypothetical protein [Myxococcaceae bacterium]
MTEPKDWKLERVLLGLIAALVAGCAAALWLLPRERETIEYGGTCGWFRLCVRTNWFFDTCSTDTKPTALLRPFAPLEACEGDWHLVSDSREYVRPFGRVEDRYVERTLSDEPVPTFIALTRYLGMQRRARREHGAYDAKLDPLRLGPPGTSYRRMDCAGYANRFSPDAFTVVLGTGPEAGPPTDCWAATSEGELRHVPRR